MLTPEIKEIISEQLCLIVTVNKQGKPDVAPKGTMRVLNEEGKRGFPKPKAAVKIKVTEVIS